jgi:hypothetical protein
MTTNQIRRFSDPETEKTLTSSFSQERELVKQDSGKMAKRHLPSLSGDSMGSYFEDHHMHYQSLLDGVNKLYQMETTVNEGLQSKNATSKKVLAIQAEISDAEQALIKIDEELKKRPEPTSPNRHKWIMAIIIILCLFDGLFSVPIFESLGYSKVESWGIGIIFGLILAVFAHIFPKIVNMGKTKIIRILITLGLSSLSIGLFVFMSLSRVKYLEALAQSQGVSVSYSPIPFILTSILMLGTSVFLSYFYYPKKEELIAIKEYLNLKAEKKRLEDEIKAKNKEIESIEGEHDSCINDKGSLIIYARQLENMIISEAMGSYILYKKNNLMNRADGKPDCYDQLYPFEFHTYFNTPKLLSNEEA